MPDDFADGSQARLAVAVLQPANIGRDGGRAGLDAAVIGIDHRLGGAGLAVRIIEEPHHIVLQGALIGFQGQDIIAALRQ